MTTSLELSCPACGKLLRIASEHAGKQIRCPVCQHISSAARSSAETANLASTDPPPADQGWHLRAPQGPVYGPIAWPDVERWASEGRITADFQLAQSSAGPWSPVSILLPQLAAVAPSMPPPEPALPASVAVHSNTPRWAAPHRGGLILALGIIGVCVTCPIVSLMAWVMGSHDLSEMRAGRMDRSGEGPTQVGQVLGLIFSLLWIVCGLITLAIGLLVAVASHL